MAAELEKRGIRRALAGESPDFIIINSCSVTEEADKKCRQFIRSANRRYPAARIIVTGCYAQLKPDEIASLPGVALVAGSDRKSLIPDYVEKISSEPVLTGSADERNEASGTVRHSPLAELGRTFSPSCSRGDRTRYFLKIQDGCDYWCTYCTIPRARGRSRSGPIDEIVAQARQAAEAGGREIVITGVNIGDFGKDTPYNFLDLIKRLDAVDEIERYRISSIEPNLLSDEIIEFVASSRRFMPHFHIPLQCGSDEVLRLMKRHYDTALFRRRIESIRQMIPDAFIGVDLIVGARGETEDEFRRSAEFVESIDISRLHVFPYSERPGTQALSIPHVVSQHDKHLRAARMIEISDSKLRAFSERFVGTVRPVLLEHSAAGKPMGGFTDNYLRVSLEAPAEFDNTIVGVRLDAISAESPELIQATLNNKL